MNKLYSGLRSNPINQLDNYSNYESIVYTFNGTVIDKINKKDSQYKVPTAKEGLVYTGLEQILINAGSTTTGTVKYSSDNINWSTTVPSGTNAGTYTFYWKVVGDFEHNDTESTTITTSISKATPTYTAPTGKENLLYTGETQELVNAGSTDSGTLQYSLDGENWGTSIPTATNAGSYTVKYRIVGDSNVNDVAAVNVQCSINEKQVTTAVELSQDVYTYDGTAKQPTVVVKDGTTVIDPSEYNVAYSNNVNAGTATVTITDKSAGNYNVIGSATFTINKADRTLSFTTAPSSVDAGSTITVAAAASAGDGTITYSSSNTAIATVVGDVVTGVAAGTCNIIANIAASQNYNAATASYQLSVEVPQPEYVDLGLPSGLLWLKHNLDANSEEETGLYYAWGETTGYADAAARNTALGRDDGFSESSYVTISDTILTPTHDAAYQKTNGDYRMPTAEECSELVNGCTISVVTRNGVKGMLFTSKTNSNSIFIPVSGNYYGNTLSAGDANCVCWSSSKNGQLARSMYGITANASVKVENEQKYSGSPIRPVKDPEPAFSNVTRNGSAWNDEAFGGSIGTLAGTFNRTSYKVAVVLTTAKPTVGQTCTPSKSQECSSTSFSFNPSDVTSAGMYWLVATDANNKVLAVWDYSVEVEE